MVMLPDDPVEAYVGYQFFIRPLVRRLAGAPVVNSEQVNCLAGADLPGGLDVVQVRFGTIREQQGERVVVPLGNPSHPRLADLVGADAMIVLDESPRRFSWAIGWAAAAGRLRCPARPGIAAAGGRGVPGAARLAGHLALSGGGPASDQPPRGGGVGGTAGSQLPVDARVGRHDAAGGDQPGTGIPRLAALTEKQAKLNKVLPFGLAHDPYWPKVTRLAEQSRLIGQVSVSNISEGSARSASVGYWIDQRYAGRGIVPTAVALACDYCWQVMKLHRIEICIRPENERSLRVVQKLGFREEGMRPRYLHINGDWRDHRVFALNAEEVPEGAVPLPGRSVLMARRPGAP